MDYLRIALQCGIMTEAINWKKAVGIGAGAAGLAGAGLAAYNDLKQGENSTLRQLGNSAKNQFDEVKNKITSNPRTAPVGDKMRFTREYAGSNTPTTSV